MSPVTDCSGSTRPTIQLAEGPVDRAFIKSAAMLADQNPGWSGVFFAKFLAAYYDQVALGTCNDVEDSLGSALLQDPQANGLLRSMYSQAAELYRACHRLQEITNSLETVGTDGSFYLTELVESMRHGCQSQARIAAGILRDARSVRRFIVEQVSQNKSATLTLRFKTEG